MLTRIFLAHRNRVPHDRATAWACLTANLFVLPGLGSWLAGKSIGWLQMALALAGLGLTILWPIWFVKMWVTFHEVPTDLGPHFGKALVGMALFAIAWTWALASSLSILRDVGSEKTK